MSLETEVTRLTERLRELEDRILELEQSIAEMADCQLSSAIGFETDVPDEFDEDGSEYKGAEL